MAAGRIKIWKKQNEIVSGRCQEKEPILHHKCWCDIGDLYGTELYKALEIRLENTIVFEVRYCKAIKEMHAHLKEYYIEYEEEKYEIYAMDLKKHDRQKVQIKANRIG